MTDLKKLVHQKDVVVAWGDMDALGHVNNARYFEYFQEARIEWLATISFDLKQTTGPVIVHTACTYLFPVVYPATLVLKTYLYGLSRSSLMVDHLLYQDEQLVAEGVCKIVWIDYLKKSSIPLPEEIRNILGSIDAISRG